MKYIFQFAKIKMYQRAEMNGKEKLSQYKSEIIVQTILLFNLILYLFNRLITNEL